MRALSNAIACVLFALKRSLPSLSSPIMSNIQLEKSLWSK